MNLEGLLTYFGLLVAALAIMGPVQRRALALFVPKWLLPASTLTALICLMFRDMPLGVPPIFGWRLDLLTYFLTLGTFVIPVAAAIWSWWSWQDAKLTPRGMRGLEVFFEAALQENEFDEVVRILRKNRHILVSMPAGAASALFQPRMVKHLVESHSVIHLELLANMAFLESLDNRLQAVEVVVRELLYAESSPLQSAVVKRFGGIEHLRYTDAEMKIIESTLQSPAWYRASNAHYPLLLTAINKIESGELDAAYNKPNKSYEATQGVSMRATCPIYLAEKTIVLAIETAIDAGDESDFYISDLLNLLDTILGRSKYDPAFTPIVGIQADYTPYSYLLDQIMGDLERLTAISVQMSVRKNEQVPNDSCPGRVGVDLVGIWATCTWLLMGEPNKLDPMLLERIVERYFRFMFACGWETSEILYSSAQGVTSLNCWRDKLLKEIKHLLGSPRMQHLTVLKSVLKNLDFGKWFIHEGYEWLKTQLHPSLLP